MMRYDVCFLFFCEAVHGEQVTFLVLASTLARITIAQL